MWNICPDDNSLFLVESISAVNRESLCGALSESTLQPQKAFKLMGFFMHL